jgi:hypothetical protein
MVFSSSDSYLKNEARKSYGLPDIFKINKDNLLQNWRSVSVYAETSSILVIHWRLKIKKIDFIRSEMTKTAIAGRLIYSKIPSGSKWCQ